MPDIHARYSCQIFTPDINAGHSAIHARYARYSCQIFMPASNPRYLCQASATSLKRLVEFGGGVSYIMVAVSYPLLPLFPYSRISRAMQIIIIIIIAAIN